MILQVRNMGVLLLYPSPKHNLQRPRNVLKLKRLGGLKQPLPGPNKCSQTPGQIGLSLMNKLIEHYNAQSILLATNISELHKTLSDTIGPVRYSELKTDLNYFNKKEKYKLNCTKLGNL